MKDFEMARGAWRSEGCETYWGGRNVKVVTAIFKIMCQHAGQERDDVAGRKGGVRRGWLACSFIGLIQYVILQLEVDDYEEEFKMEATPS